MSDEYRRRIRLAHDGAAVPDEIVRLNRQIMTMRRGIGRLIDSYAEGLIDKAEFEPRIAGLKHRLSQLDERHRAALDAIDVERDLLLVISRLEDFSDKVAKRLDCLDGVGMQEIIRILVRRIEIDCDTIEVVFRIPPLEGPGRPPPSGKTASWQQCTGVGGKNFRMAEPLPQAGEGLGVPQSKGSRIPPTRINPPHVAKAVHSHMMFPDRLLQFFVCGNVYRWALLSELEKAWSQLWVFLHKQDVNLH